MKEPLISVVMPIYNGERYLVSAVQSIRDQTFADWELIAVDDGSTDRSRAILEEIGKEEARVRVISRPNTGIVGALNDGIEAARGRYVARMDADDLSLPERFERQAAYLDDHPGCVLVGTHVLRVDPEGLPIGPEDQPVDHEGILAKLLEGSAGTLTHPSIMMRRDALVAAGAYRAEFQWVEDYDLYLRLVDFGTLANLPGTLLHYRLHHESVNMKKRHLQGALAARCLSEACARLGLPDRQPTALLGWLAKPRDRVSTRRGWARRALACGYYLTARKHAGANILAQPWNPAWWKLLTLSLLKVPTLNLRARLRGLLGKPPVEARG